MKKLSLILALCYLAACQAPDANEILAERNDIEGLVKFPDVKPQDCIHIGRVVSTQLAGCGPVILLENGIMLEARIVPDPAPDILYTLGHPVQIAYRVLPKTYIQCPVDYVVEITCIQEPEGVVSNPVDYDTLISKDQANRAFLGSYGDTETSFSEGATGNYDEPFNQSACKYTGTVIETDVTACGLLIRLDNGIQLEPRNLDKSLKVGQRVKLTYELWKDQTSICDAGLVVDIFCLTLLDEFDLNVSHKEVVHSDTH